jgi:hypothetical protein
MRDVKELVKDMNIQFDNLCQVGGGKQPVLQQQPQARMACRACLPVLFHTAMSSHTWVC